MPDALLSFRYIFAATRVLTFADVAVEDAMRMQIRKPASDVPGGAKDGPHAWRSIWKWSSPEPPLFHSFLEFVFCVSVGARKYREGKQRNKGGQITETCYSKEIGMKRSSAVFSMSYMARAGCTGTSVPTQPCRACASFSLNLK